MIYLSMVVQPKSNNDLMKIVEYTKALLTQASSYHPTNNAEKH